MTDRELSAMTRATRAGMTWDGAHHAVVPPIYLSTTYAFEELGVSPGYEYSRTSNPTRDLLGATLASLEGGAAATVTSTGMAAITTMAAAAVPAGGTVAIPRDCYGGTWRLFDALAAKHQFEVVSVDFTDAAATEALWARRPSLVLVETPSNPLLRITDIAAVTEAAHRAGSLVAVDNTFCSPALQRPLELGADLVVHSTTKYLNGHSDVVGGAVISATAELGEQMDWWGNCLGTTGGAFDAYLILRGVRTLGVRMEAHCRNAQALAELLAQHPAVGATYYPGLADHEGHDLAKRQQSGFGGMVSFTLRDLDAVRRCLDGLQCFSLAESLGGVESLICHPASMTHSAMPADVQAAAGITDNLLRIAVGIEIVDDLLADLQAGLNRAL